MNRNIPRKKRERYKSKIIKYLKEASNQGNLTVNMEITGDGQHYNISILTENYEFKETCTRNARLDFFYQVINERKQTIYPAERPLDPVMHEALKGYVGKLLDESKEREESEVKKDKDISRMNRRYVSQKMREDARNWLSNAFYEAAAELDINSNDSALQSKNIRTKNRSKIKKIKNKRQVISCTN